MIKSSDQNFDNTYYVLRVLANRDYLALDQNHNHCILSEHPRRPTSVTQGQELAIIKHRGQNEHIIQCRECIEFESNSYSVFEVGQKAPVWVKDIDHNKMSSRKFTNTLMKDAICNILAELVWLNRKDSHRYLTLRNFWLVNGHIRLIMMPRFDQNHTIQRTEQQRSYSQQTSKLTQVIEQSMLLIKRFASILWQIIQPSFTIKQYQQSAPPKIKVFLQKMLNKQLSINEIVQEANELEGTPVSVDLQARRSFGIHNGNRSKFSSRRLTLQPSIHCNSVQKNRISTEKYTSQNVAYTGLKMQSRYKTQLVRQNEASSLLPKASNNTIFKQRSSGQKPRRYLNFKANSYSQTSFSYNGKLNRDVTPQRRIAIAQNQRERTKYLNWIRDRKMSIFQQVTRLSTIARQKFKKSITNEQPQPNTIDSSQLAVKIFSKALRFRQQKYRTVSQTTATPEKMATAKQLDSILRRSQREKIILQLESKILEGDTIKKQPSSQDITSNRKIKQQPTSADIFPKAGKSQVPVEPSNQKQETTRRIEESPFERPSIHGIESEEIEQLQSYQLSSHSAVPNPNKSEKEPKQRFESRWLDTRSNIPRQKMKRIKMTKSDVSNKDEDQIETINLTFKETNHSHNHLTTQATQSKEKQLRSDLVPLSAHSQEMQASSHDAETSAILKKVTEAVKQFLTLINILGDASIKCIHAKKHLGDYEWRKSVFFLYERFHHERDSLLEQLVTNQFGIVRHYHNISEQHFRLWYRSQEYSPLVETLRNENVRIAATYEQFSKKTLEQCEFQPMIQNFIKNRAKILAKGDKNLRAFISKYAVAFIINEYDTAIERKENSKEVGLYISRCLFALRVIAELDSRSSGRERVKLADYVDLKVEVEGQGDWVQRLYEAYYPQEEKV